MSYRLFVTLISSITLCTPFLYSAENDGVFLSLTRTAASVESMPSNTTVITKTEIQQSGARNLQEALAAAPGLQASVTGTPGQLSNLSIRGSSAAQVLLLIDGRRLNDIGNGTVDLSSVPTENIERIEIIRGGASALYGTGALGGVVNIITRKPGRAGGEPAATAAVSYGAFNTQNYQLNAAAGNNVLTGRFTASKTASDGWRDNSAYDNYQVTTRFGYAAGAYGTFDLSGSLFRSSCGTPGKAVLADGSTSVTPDEYDGHVELAASSPQAHQKDNRDQVRLSHTLLLESLTITSALYHTDEKRFYQDPVNIWGALDNEFTAGTFGAEVQVNAPYGITAGMEWWQERFTETNLLTDTAVSDHRRITTAGYLQEEVSAGRLTLIPSLRFDENSVFGSIVAPRLTVVYALSEPLSLSANAGKSWRAPTFDDLYSPMGGNPALLPEEGITTDVGVKYTQHGIRAAATWFVTDAKNYILWAPIDPADPYSFWIPKNIETSRQSGIEAAYAHQILPRLTHTLNYTYLTISGTDNQKLVMYRPQQSARYGLSYAAGTFTTVKLSAQYVSSQKTETAAIDLPAYVTLGAGVTHTVKDAEFWLSVDNCTDKKYQTRLGYPLPGATVTGGVRISFRG